MGVNANVGLGRGPLLPIEFGSVLCMGSLSTSLQAICHVSYNLVSDKDLSHSDRYWHSVLLLRGIPFDASFGHHTAINCFPILDCLSTRVVCERLCAIQYARAKCTLNVFRSIQG